MTSNGLSVPRGAIVVFLILPLACSSEGSASHHDGGPSEGGLVDGNGDAPKSFAGVDVFSPVDVASLDSTTLPRIDTGLYASGCMTSGDCPVGEICCADIGSIVMRASCSAEATCSGGAEVCSSGGSSGCTSGVCQEYLCMFSGTHLETTVYACKAPVLTGAACNLVYDASNGIPVDGGS